MTQVDTLEITTMSACSVRCAICPQDALKAAYPADAPHRLTLVGFQQALSNTPKHVRIHFSGLVEPWLNRECTVMLHIALEKGYRVAVYTTCVGMKSHVHVAALLVSYRHMVDVVCVHMADGSNMRDTQWSTARHEFAEALSKGGLEPEVMSMDPAKGFEAIDRAGLVQIGKAPTHHVGPIKCSYSDTYSHNVMLPNGDVHLCCMDYSLSARLGNLFRDNFTALDRYTVSEMNACDDSENICRRCHGAVAS